MTEIEEVEFKLDLKQALNELSERERSLIVMRYGLNDGVPKTLDEIGRVHGITTARVRKYLAKVHAKLTHPANPMHEYLTQKEQISEVAIKDWIDEAKEWEVEEAEAKAIRARERQERELMYAKRDLLAMQDKVRRLEINLNGN